jgi:hypothetical protein
MYGSYAFFVLNLIPASHIISPNLPDSEWGRYPYGGHSEEYSFWSLFLWLTYQENCIQTEYVWNTVIGHSRTSVENSIYFDSYIPDRVYFHVSALELSDTCRILEKALIELFRIRRENLYNNRGFQSSK